MSRVVLKFEPIIEVLSDENKSIIYNFECGEKAFDDYIKLDAVNDMMSGDGVTYLVINEALNKRELVGYYTITSSTIHIIDRYDFEDDDIPKEEKREHFSPISSFLIKMFAVNVDYQDSYYKGQLVSSLILRNMISNLYDMSTSVVGAKRIILCAVEKARKL